MASYETEKRRGRFQGINIVKPSLNMCLKLVCSKEKWVNDVGEEKGERNIENNV